MVDREKVIKWLGFCISGNTAICKRVGCPYAEEHDGIGDTCIDHLMADALALLKAQEPIEPIFDYDGKDVWRCGNCHSNIFHPSRTDADENEKNYRRFCFHCGRAVKWYE